MVCAAGNSGAIAAYHLEHNVTADTSFTWFKPNQGVVGFEVWADAADLANVNYAIGADRVTPTFGFRGNTPFRGLADNLGTVTTDTLWSASGNRLGILNMLVNQRGAQYLSLIHISEPTRPY